MQEFLSFAREGGLSGLARDAGVFDEFFPAPLGGPASLSSPQATSLPAPSIPPASPTRGAPMSPAPAAGAVPAKRGPGRPPKRPREDDKETPRKARRGGRSSTDDSRAPKTGRASGPSHPGGEDQERDKSGKAPGLRHFSMLVCKKVENRRVTTYNEVADELVAEGGLSSQESSNGAAGATTGSAAADQNIRRRVYDVLNVLIALGVITKEKKSIRWVGLPPNASDEAAKLEAERGLLLESIQAKKERLMELATQKGIYTELVRRNRERAAAAGAQAGAQGTPPGDRKIQVPFIVVHTKPTAFIQCEVASDYSEVFLNFNQPFEICDDTTLLRFILAAPDPHNPAAATPPPSRHDAPAAAAEAADPAAAAPKQQQGSQQSSQQSQSSSQQQGQQQQQQEHDSDDDTESEEEADVLMIPKPPGLLREESHGHPVVLTSKGV
eukprot:m51a1_g6174 hypothetical protein (440) ;mRNA; r:12065-13745